MLRLSALALLLGSTQGCQTYLPSPPSVPMMLEAPRALDPGRTSVGLTSSAQGQVFGGPVRAGTVTVAHGLTEHVEGNVSASAMVLERDQSSSYSPLIGAARVGAKVELGTRHASLTGGVGGGSWMGGPFVSPDLGVVVGYDNRYLVPFLSVRGGLSVPLAPQSVDVTPGDGSAGGRQIASPHFTRYTSATTGLRVPIGDPTNGVAGAIQLGASLTSLVTEQSTNVFVGLGLGGEVSF